MTATECGKRANDTGKTKDRRPVPPARRRSHPLHILVVIHAHHQPAPMRTMINTGVNSLSQMT